MNEEESPQPDLVTVEWRNGMPTSVVLSADWKLLGDPDLVIRQIVEAVRNQHPAPTTSRPVRLGDVRLSELPQFNELLVAANQEAERAVDPPVQEQETTHFTTRWRDGWLLSLIGDLEWMANAGRQQIVDELLEVITAPDPLPTTSSTAARDRLAAFLHGAA